MNPEFHLTRGGPTHRLLQKVGLLREDHASSLRPAFAIALLAWLPLAAWALFELLSTGKVGAYFLNLSVHVRFWLVVPLMFVAARLLDQRCEEAVSRFLLGRFAPDEAAIERVLERARRARDSVPLDGILWLVAFSLGQLKLWHGVSLMGVELGPAQAERSFPDLWQGLVFLPVSNYFFMRILFSWSLWSWMLWRFSRQKLRLEPIHPDGAGGLAHLAEPTQGFRGLLFALSAMTASVWADAILLHKAHFSSFYGSAFVFAVLGLLLTFGPLVPFAPQMLAARMAGLVKYGHFSLGYTRLFDRRWLGSEPDETVLGTPDIQSLADLANGYAVANSMRVLPFGKVQIIRTLVAAVLPMLPLRLTEVSMQTVLRQLSGALLGSSAT